MAKIKKSVSIVDVAKKAGVSVSTVSRVLNNRSLVKPGTRQQIQKIADGFGYSLPAQRPGPKPGRPTRKKKIAFLNFLDHSHAGFELPSTFLDLQHGAEVGGRELGLSIHLQVIGTETTLQEMLKDDHFIGFVMRGWRPHPTVVEYLKKKPCCWVMNNPWTPEWGDHVMPDHREAGMMAANYLFSHGCQKPIMVTLSRPDRVHALRKEGFFYAAEKNGIEVQSLISGSFLKEAGAAHSETVCVDEIISQFKQIVHTTDGIFFDNDLTLSTLYPLMVREKIIVPGKTMLIGCNNQQQLLNGIKPHPATMAVHFEQVGRIGISQLAWRIKNPDCQRTRTLISPSLIALQ